MNILKKIEKKLAKKRIPMGITFEVTKKCNLDCIHCYVDHKDTEMELTIEEQKDIIDQLYDMGVVYITFSGGELFTKKGVWELFEHTRSKNMGFKIITSATTLTRPQMDRLKELGILEVGISIYSDKEEIHDFVTRKQGSLQKSLAAAKYLTEIGITTVSKTMIMTLNKNEIEQIYSKVKSIGMIPTFDLTLIYAENNARDPKKYALSQNEIYELFKNKKIEKILLDSKSVEETYCEMNTNFKDDNPRCNIAQGTMWIDSKGYVFPCLAYPEPVGYLKNNTLKEIWYESNEIKEILELVKYKNYKACHTCEAQKYCSSCIALSKLENREDTCNTASYNRAFANKQIVDDLNKQAIIKFKK